jgi:CheY-like chemotaxis protein
VLHKNDAMPLPETPTGGQSARPKCLSFEIAAFDTQRMEALAQIAGGIAPALSDLLTVIRGQAGQLLDAAGRDPGDREPLNQIYTAADKAASLIRQLMIFSRQQTMHAEIMDLNGLIDESAGVLRRLLGDGISVDFHLASNLPLIVADRDMLEQLLIILALNARDAMPTGGRLLFKTEVVDTMGDAAKDRPDQDHKSGKFVVLHVDDTGRGIAPEILPRVFEPFFTTKADGRSAGLGLATVFGIVQQHHGWMAVESVINAGSSFQAFLPAGPPGAVVEPGRGTEAGTRAGNETILLVEDDAAVREFTVAILQQYGYRVLQASSGPEAMEVWKWHAPRVRLLLTDMVLEDHMTGLELAAKLRTESPGLKVICTSGHSRETMKRFPEDLEGCHFLQKPCRPQTLVAAVRALLDEKHP